MRSIRFALAVGLLVSGCTSTVTGSPTTVAGSPITVAGSPTAAAEVAHSALATVLDRVPAAALGVDGYFEFGDASRLRKLAATDAAVWKFQANTGTAGLSSYAAYTVATIGVDLSMADAALTVGRPPQAMIFVAGGQDASRVATAAARSGWTGTGVLTRALDVGKSSSSVLGISLVAPKLRPMGADVVLSQHDGDPTGVAEAGATAASPAAQLPGMKSTIDCLSDVATAFGTGITSTDPADWTAAGAAAGTAGAASSVICLGAADPAAAATLADAVRAAVESGRSQRSGQPWRTLLRSAEVDIVTGSPAMVRLTAGTATANLVLQMLTARDIPGR